MSQQCDASAPAVAAQPPNRVAKLPQPLPSICVPDTFGPRNNSVDSLPDPEAHCHALLPGSFAHQSSWHNTRNTLRVTTLSAHFLELPRTPARHTHRVPIGHHGDNSRRRDPVLVSMAPLRFGELEPHYGYVIRINRLSRDDDRPLTTTQKPQTPSCGGGRPVSSFSTCRQRNDQSAPPLRCLTAIRST